MQWINHWFPLIRPYSTLASERGTLRVGWPVINLLRIYWNIIPSLKLAASSPPNSPVFQGLLLLVSGSWMFCLYNYAANWSRFIYIYVCIYICVFIYIYTVHIWTSCLLGDFAGFCHALLKRLFGKNIFKTSLFPTMEAKQIEDPPKAENGP